MNWIVIYEDEPVPYSPEEIKIVYIKILKYNYGIRFERHKPGKRSYG